MGAAGSILFFRRPLQSWDGRELLKNNFAEWQQNLEKAVIIKRLLAAPKLSETRASFETILTIKWDCGFSSMTTKPRISSNFLE